jgi:hypothetical protein
MLPKIYWDKKIATPWSRDKTMASLKIVKPPLYPRSTVVPAGIKLYVSSLDDRGDYIIKPT